MMWKIALSAAGVLIAAFSAWVTIDPMVRFPSGRIFIPSRWGNGGWIERSQSPAQYWLFFVLVEVLFLPMIPVGFYIAYTFIVML